MKKIAWAEFIILLCGTVFAWSNFSFELFNWLNSKTCTFGCAAGIVNPFYTPCFYGAIFFTVAFVLSVFILRQAAKPAR